MSVEQHGTSAVQLPSSVMSADPTVPESTPRSASSTRLVRYAARVPEAYINSICGALAGVASGIVTCPLDVIKTKLQAQGGFRPRMEASGAGTSGSVAYRGMFGTAKTIIEQDGFRGLYRGLNPMLIGYLPTWAVYMGVYGAARDYYYTTIDSKTVAQIAASVTAGACSTVATNPIWVVKTRLMSQVGSSAAKDSRTPWHYKNTFDAFRQMYHAEGIGAFYNGLAPAMLGLSHVAIQFPLYEYFKLHFTGLQMGDASTDSSHSIGILAATFLSKVCATSATYPHEVLRTRMQTQQRVVLTRRHHGPLRSFGVSPPKLAEEAAEVLQNGPRYKGVIACARLILKEEGWRAFYHGMGTNLFRAVPAAMTTMYTFETLKRWIQQAQAEARHEFVS